MTSASWSGASVVRWLLVLAAVAALVFVLVWQRARVAPRGDEAERLASVEGADRRDGEAPAPPPADDGAASSGERTPPEQALGAIDPNDAWRERAARAVRPIITARLGRAPTPDEERRVVDALGTVGPAARSLDRGMLDPDDPRSIARIREQTRVLVEADRTVRDLLGIGVAELLRRLDPSGIDDQGGAAANG